MAYYNVLLLMFQEFTPDIVVCLDSWVGGIRQVNAKLHLKCPDGSRCIVDDLENFTFEDVEEKNHRVCPVSLNVKQHIMH